MIFNLDSTVSMNENSSKYEGIGYMSFMEECAQDELDIFEAAIRSDMLETLNEADNAGIKGFVTNAVNKIKEIMQKVIDFIKGIWNSIVAKFKGTFAKDNKKFAEDAEKQLNEKLKNAKKPLSFEMKLPDLKKLDKIDTQTEWLEDAIELASAILFDSTAEVSKEDLDELEKAKTTTKENIAKYQEILKDTKDTKIDEAHVRECIKALKETSNPSALIKTLKNYEALAKKAYNHAKSLEKELAKDAEGKDAAHIKVQAALAIKEFVSMSVRHTISNLKTSIRLNRAIITKALTTKISEGAWEVDEVMYRAMLEVSDYEVTMALEDCDEDAKEPTEDEESEEECSK